MNANLWLDDVRPAPIGWTHCYTVAQAKIFLLNHNVINASLDHDLGACDECLQKWRDAEVVDGCMPNCSHFGTGYDLCLWMAENGVWPREKPVVHSANPVGAARMRGVIQRYFNTRMGEELKDEETNRPHP